MLTNTFATPPIYDDTLTRQLQDALAAVADMETRYAVDRERLTQWQGPEALKQSLSSELETRRRKDRQALDERLDALHKTMLSSLGFGSARSTAAHQ